MIAERFQTFLLDLDGVVYIGDEALPGACSSLQKLREWGKTLRFLTNDPRPTRKQIVERLRRFGIEANVGEVVTCGWATAAYLRESRVRSAYVVGSEGLSREVEEAGIKLTDGDDTEAVIVGCDEGVGYPHIQRAARLIFRGARFIATNEDPTFPTPEGPAPATGSIVAAVRTASGEQPHVIGKPHSAMFKIALRDLDPAQAVMIGDSPATDILGARQSGITAVLLAYEDARPQPGHNLEEPDLVICTLADIFDMTIRNCCHHIRKCDRPTQDED